MKPIPPFVGPYSCRFLVYISLTKPLFITFCSVEAKELVSTTLDYMGVWWTCVKQE